MGAEVDRIYKSKPGRDRDDQDPGEYGKYQLDAHRTTIKKLLNERKTWSSLH
ncbi:MAG: hypothetical protein V3R30_02260 [Kiloniellales bacterium]